MASPIFIRIYNYTSHSITTEVTDHRDLEDDGSNFNEKTISANTAYESSTEVKTGAGNGELTIVIKQGTLTLGFFKMKDLKNPHEGLNSLEVPSPPAHPYQFTSAAFRKLASEPEDNRYIYLVVNAFPTNSSLP
jgi:hypothetical protein